MNKTWRDISLILLIKILILCSFLLNTHKSYASVDSLEQLIQKYKITNDPKKQFELLINLADGYKHIDPTRSINYAHDALKLARRHQNTKQIGHSHSMLGRIYFFTGNFKQALEADSEALKNFITVKDSLKIADTYADIGEDYRGMAEAGKAIEHYFLALKIYESTNNQKRQYFIYNNIGIVYRSQKEHEKAIENYRKALEMSFAINDSLQISKIYNNIANVYADLNKLGESLKMHQKALELRIKLNKPYYISGSLLNIGGIYERLGEYNKSLKYFDEAVIISKEINDDYTLGLAYYNIGFVLHKMGENSMAVSSIQEAVFLAKNQGNLNLLKEAHFTLSEIYLQLNLFEDALEHKVLEYNYKDSIIKKENEQKLLELTTKYETAQKEKEIKILQNEKQIATISKNVYLAGFAIVIVILVLLFMVFRTRIKKNMEIIARQKELHIKEQQLNVAELEKKQLKESYLENELELKSKQLTVHTLNIIQKNELLEELQTKLNDIKNSNGDANLKLNSMNQFINYSLNIDKDWEEFSLHFEQVNHNFFKRLIEQFPELSPSDIRLAALIKLNMSIKEAAAVLNISPGSVKTARYRLRRKLSLKNEEDLNMFLVTY